MLSRFWDPKAARVFFTALIFLAVLAFLHGARETLTLFLFAILFAYFVTPLVDRLERPLRGRIKSIGVVYVILIAAVIGLGFIVGPRVVREGKALATSLPSLVGRMGSGEFVFQLGQKHGWSYERQAQIQSFMVSHEGDVLKFGQTLGAKLSTPAQHIWWVILIPILSLFFLKDGRKIANGVVELGRAPEERRTLDGIVQDVNIMLGSYIRAQLILASLTLVSYTLILSLMRVPYAFVLGPLAGIFEFVPVVGPALAAVTVVVIALLASYHPMVLLILFLGIWRLVQDYVNAPRILGKSLEISPLVQIFGVLAGGEIAGVVGALISVPAIATLRILWRRLSDHREEKPAATPAEAELHSTTT